MPEKEKIIRDAFDALKRGRAGHEAEEKRTEEKDGQEYNFPDEPKTQYGKIPQKLLRDPEIEVGPKILWGLVHSYSPEKDLDGKTPSAFISHKTIAKDLGVSIPTIRRWIKKLKDNGWANVKRRGLGKTNIINLYSKKRA